MKKIVLDAIHRQAGAKMVNFAGFEMPVRYTSDLDEHHAVRKNVGIFDVSHMGEFTVKGKNATDFLQKITSNNVAKLYDGKVQYSCFPNETGGIVDDLLVYRIKQDEYFLVVNASNIEKDWQHISKYLPKDGSVTIENLSDELCLFAVQGVKAVDVLQKLTDLPLAEMEYYTFRIGNFAGVDNIIVSATGYTGAGGFEIYVPNAYAESVWNQIMKAGAPENIKPIGLGARDTLRLEKGYCLYGNDINDNTSPLEAGLGWITYFQKDFVGKEALEMQKKEGIKRKLVGFKMTERAIPRSHYTICTADNKVIGEVTSGTMSPTLGYGIGMGYVEIPFAAIGTEIYVVIRDKPYKAVVCKLPFL